MMIAEGQGGKGEHKAAVVVTTRRVCLDRTHPDTFVETNINFKVQRQILKGTKTSSRDKYKLEKTKANKRTDTNKQFQGVDSNRTHPNIFVETMTYLREQTQIQIQKKKQKVTKFAQIAHTPTLMKRQLYTSENKGKDCYDY